jgi:hypothetical protein
MDELEFEILDSLYFVEPFQTLADEVSERRIPVIKDCLRELINKHWVKVMQWDEKEETFMSSPFVDFDSMEDFHYLITKEGLLAHNTK